MLEKGQSWSRVCLLYSLPAEAAERKPLACEDDRVDSTAIALDLCRRCSCSRLSGWIEHLRHAMARSEQRRAALAPSGVNTRRLSHVTTCLQSHAARSSQYSCIKNAQARNTSPMDLRSLRAAAAEEDID